MKTLDHISQELLTLGQHLVEQEGEIDLFLEEELDRVNHDLEVKVDNYAFRLQMLKSRAEFWYEKANFALEVQIKIEKHIHNLQQRIMAAMELLNKKELVGEESKFTIKKNPPKVIIENEEIIPSPYKISTTTIKPDKKLIAETIKQGKEVPGAKLVQGESLKLGINKGI